MIYNWKYTYRQENIFEIFKIEYDMPKVGMLSIEIVDLKGTVIFEEKKHRKEGKIELPIQVAHSTPGVHHVLLKNEYECISRKIVFE